MLMHALSLSQAYEERENGFVGNLTTSKRGRDALKARSIKS